MAIKRRLTRIRLDKIAAVDNPCQVHATVGIMKRAPAAPVGPEAIIKTTFQQALSGCLVADQVNQAFYSAFNNMYDGQSAFRTALIDELQDGGDGTAASAAYKSWLSDMVDQALVSAKASGAATLTDDDLEKAFTTVATEWLVSKKEPTVMAITTKAALLAAITKFDPTKSTVADQAEILTAATTLGAEDHLPVSGPLAKVAPPADVAKFAALEEEVAILKMTADEKTHMATLSDADKKKFLAMASADRKTEMAKRDDSDPVVYKCADGTEIRKSDGAAAALFAKRFDEQDKVIKGLTDQVAGDSIAKRAAKFPHIAKAASIIKGIDLIEDEKERAEALEGLTALNKARAPLFKALGTLEGEGGGEGGESPKAVMDAIVEKIAKRDSISIGHATIAAQADPEFKRAYAESIARPGQVSAE